MTRVKEKFRARMDLYDRMITEDVFILNSSENCVIKVARNGKYFARFKGEPEREINPLSGILSKAMLEAREISKSEYESFQD